MSLDIGVDHIVKKNVLIHVKFELVLTLDYNVQIMRLRIYLVVNVSVIQEEQGGNEKSG